MLGRVSKVVFTLATSLALICSLFPSKSHALYFYLEGSEQKCFIEELPKDTSVFGEFKAEEYSDQQGKWIINPETQIQILVEELPQGNVIVHQKGSASGRFTFTSSDSGDHSICLSATSNAWFSSTRTRLHLDMDIGDPTDHVQDHTETLGDLESRVRELNQRVQDIRREQSYQREREAEFRDQSESTNSRVVWWTIMQIIILGAVCVWQMRHYKGFFVAKKLV
ncbi:emp24p/erv25p-related protein [Umbelopsis sp. WA50703]